MDEEDYSERFERLTARKRDCLREAAKGYSSKEIARILSLSPSTVDNHFQDIRKEVGSIPRRKLARLFVKWEARQGGQKIPPHPMTISDDGISGPTASTETKADVQATQGEDEEIFAEEQRPYGLREHSSPLRVIVPLRVAGRQRNDLNGPSILVVFSILTTLMLFAVGAGISLLSALNGFAGK
ncbi:helix-turn-helix transcriptional regulator [Sphingobium sp. BHU LFT2]|uniref:helix-turn-helix domain-containing protein n=1 Tax=Sphingobium sp. BHU LFT2 TaxID=2807634 RepID=UPI001BE5296A|nr:helix-turn-helix transcriptional regulator [Sphingobium sp. BHU LFT2]MBT2246849.1 helix-turn-helix transcriptional regulator [Sphingobium sp. BHU LFT2]